MKRSSRWLLVVVVILAGLDLGHAAAQTASDLDIRIERDTQERPAINELGVFHRVSIIERATGKPPIKRYEVYGLAENEQGEQTQSFTCSHARDNDPNIDAGVYYCQVFVDHGGIWDFVAVINEPRAAPDDPPVTVTQAVAAFELETSQVYTGDGDEGPTTSAGDVALLWFHVLAATAWSLCAAALAGLAVPSLRRRLSALAINRLEWRFDSLVKTSWAITAAVTGSGAYLVFNETAYQTPSSPSDFDAVFALPYAKPYYLSLIVKVGLYALMVAALGLLVRGARQQLRTGLGTTEAVAAAPSATPAWGGGGSSPVMVIESPPASSGGAIKDERRTPRFAAAAGVVVAIGLLGISLCVTLLKYFHQIIEAGFAAPSS